MLSTTRKMSLCFLVISATALESGIGWRLHPDHPCVRLDGGCYVFGIGGVHKGALYSHPTGALPEVSVGPAVDVIHGDNVVPGLQDVGDGLGGAQSAGEAERVLGSVQGCEVRLQNSSGRIATPAVFVHLEVRGGVLLEGGGERDLRHHGHAVPLLGLLADMESLGGEVLIILSVLRHGGSSCVTVRVRGRGGSVDWLDVITSYTDLEVAGPPPPLSASLRNNRYKTFTGKTAQSIQRMC